MKTLILAAVAAFFMSGILAGCATDSNSGAKLTTYYGTMKIIDGDPAKAERVAEVANKIRQYALGETNLTVDLLITAIRSEIRWEKVDAADEMILQVLIDELRNALISRFGENVLPADLVIAVDTVAGWVITASRM